MAMVEPPEAADTTERPGRWLPGQGVAGLLRLAAGCVVGAGIYWVITVIARYNADLTRDVEPGDLVIPSVPTGVVYAAVGLGALGCLAAAARLWCGAGRAQRIVPADHCGARLVAELLRLVGEVGACYAAALGLGMGLMVLGGAGVGFEAQPGGNGQAGAPVAGLGDGSPVLVGSVIMLVGPLAAGIWLGLLYLLSRLVMLRVRRASGTGDAASGEPS